jgi:hypothetical protein
MGKAATLEQKIVVDISTLDAKVAALDRPIAELTKDGAGAGERIAAHEQAVKDAEAGRERARNAFLGASVAERVGDASPGEVAALSRALQDAEIAVQDAEMALTVEMQAVPARALKIAQLRDRRRDLLVPMLIDRAESFEGRFADWLEQGEQLAEEGRALADQIERDGKLFRSVAGLRLDDRIPLELVAIARLLTGPAFQTVVQKAHNQLVKLSKRQDKQPLRD